jgi:hypothetical protein
MAGYRVLRVRCKAWERVRQREMQIRPAGKRDSGQGIEEASGWGINLGALCLGRGSTTYLAQSPGCG